MTAEQNVNTQGLPAARQDAGNNPTETVFRRRRDGRDEQASSRNALASKQPAPDMLRNEEPDMRGVPGYRDN